jgi:methionyl-tRNA formyltransferase
MIERGDAPEPQDESLVTLAPKVDRETARIDWTRSAADVARHINAMDPAPGAWTTFAGKTIKLYQAGAGHRLPEGPIPLRPPGHLAPQCPRLTVAASDGWVDVGWVTEEGRQRRPSDDWVLSQMQQYHGEPPALA